MTNEIAALLYRYARAVDTKDWELYRSVFTDDAYIDYSSAGAMAGTRDEVAHWLSTGFGAIPMSMHYISNIEVLDHDGDTARVRAMFYNPMQLPGMTELSYCGGYYHHEMVRTADGWRSRSLREESIWFVNGTGGRPSLNSTPPRPTSTTPRRDCCQIVKIRARKSRSDSSFGGEEGKARGTSPRRPIDHRRRRFRGRGCRAPCMTRRALGPV